MKNKVLSIIAVVIGVIIMLFIGGYNSLQRADENVNEKWGQVENQLQRRYDLIPQLVAVVKQYSDYEASTLENIVALRGNGTLGEEAAADTAYQEAMKEFNVTVEAYPELKASEEYSQLMTDLSGTENRIAVARKDYNDAVSSLNKSIRAFPTNIIANLSGIERRYYFEVNNNVLETPDVSGLFNQ